MKSTLLLTLILGFTFVASAKPKTDECAKRLGIPKQYRPQFRGYVASEYLPELTPVKITDVGGDKVTLAVFAPRSDEKVEVDIGLTMQGFFEDADRKKFAWDEINIDHRLPIELSWRIVLAHLLNRHPTISSVEWFSYGQADEATVRQALLEGLTAEAAFRKTAVFASSTAFGFELKKVQITVLPPLTALIRGDIAVRAWMKRPSAADPVKR